MLHRYDPRVLWYFTHPDGRVLKTPDGKIVDKADAGYLAFVEAQGYAPAWPVDDAGQPTDAEMDAVLRPFGLCMTGALREAYGDDLLRVLTDGEVAAMSSASPRDQRTFSIQRAPFVETDPAIVALAAAVKVEPRAWFDRIFKPGA